MVEEIHSCCYVDSEVYLYKKPSISKSDIRAEYALYFSMSNVEALGLVVNGKTTAGIESHYKVISLQDLMPSDNEFSLLFKK